jgi:hypothetical protein
MVHQSIWYRCSVTIPMGGVQEHGSLGSPILKAISTASVPSRNMLCEMSGWIACKCKPDEQSAMVHRSVIPGSPACLVMAAPVRSAK